MRILGEQVNTGIEAQATGKIARKLVIYGGVTLLDPKSVSVSVDL